MTPEQRIPDIRTAERCIRAIQTYLTRRENPLAAADLAVAVQRIREHERSQERQPPQSASRATRP